MSARWNQIVAAVLCGILIGLVAGAKLQEYRTRKIDTFKEAGPDPQRVIKGLTERLGIDEKQGAVIKQISEKRRAEVLALQSDVYGRFEAIRLGMRDDIRKELTPEQRKKFDDIVAKWDVTRRRAEPPPMRPAANLAK